MTEPTATLPLVKPDVAQSSKDTQPKNPAVRKTKSPPRYLWFSGWELSPSDFIEFVRGVPGMGPTDNDTAPKPKHDVMVYVNAYDTWRLRILKQKGTYKPPALRVREDNKRKKDYVLGLFFTVRGLEYRTKKQVEDGHPQAESIKTPTDRDLAQLAAFQTSIVQDHNGKIDTSKAFFSYMKGFHPKHDPYWSVNF